MWFSPSAQNVKASQMQQYSWFTYVLRGKKRFQHSPQILIRLFILRYDSVAHLPRGEIGFQLCSIKVPLCLSFLFLPKQLTERLEFPLSSSVWRQKTINDERSSIQLNNQSLSLSGQDNQQD